MKFLKMAIIALVTATSFVACSKDKDDDFKQPPAFAIEGTWEGKLGTGSAIPSSYIGIVVKPGGSLDRLKSDGSVTASGTWTLNNNTFTGSYIFSDGVTVNFTSSVDKVNGKIEGTWTNSGNNSGTFYISKK